MAATAVTDLACPATPPEPAAGPLSRRPWGPTRPVVPGTRPRTPLAAPAAAASALDPRRFSRGSTGGQCPDRLGGHRPATNPPVSAGHLLDDDPGDGAHVLPLHRDHRVGYPLDDLLLLLRGEHTLDHL